MKAKILSLYDGMACGMIAMLNAGVEVESYDAYEIDKYAIQTATHNFPIIKEHGDAITADYSQYEGVDFIIGGSPCTYWSIAQSSDRRETTASGIGWELFSHYVRAVKEAKPKYFIYENNKSMSKAIKESITETFRFEPILINSALVSAQNRQRLYWVGKRNADGTYSKVDVEQPQDKGILLKDILESGIGWQDKSYCMTATYAGAVLNNTLERSQRTMVAEPVCVAQRGRYIDNNNRLTEQHYEARTDGKTNTLTTVQKDNQICEPVRVGCMPTEDGEIKNGQGYRIYSTDGKAIAQTTSGGGIGSNTGLYAVPVRVGALPRPNGELSTSQAFRIYSIEGKSVNLTSGGGGAGGKTGLYAIPVEYDENNVPVKAMSLVDNKEHTVYFVKDNFITIKGKQYPIKLKDGYYIIRKLTIAECKRLQTVPDWYNFPVSNAQAYKMLGNGWTCDVITHLIKSCIKEN